MCRLLMIESGLCFRWFWICFFAFTTLVFGSLSSYGASEIRTFQYNFPSILMLYLLYPFSFLFCMTCMLNQKRDNISMSCKNAELFFKERLDFNFLINPQLFPIPETYNPMLFIKTYRYFSLSFLDIVGMDFQFSFLDQPSCHNHQIKWNPSLAEGNKTSTNYKLLAPTVPKP